MRHNHPKSDQHSEWWDIKTAASYLGMSVGFIRKAVRLKTIPFARLGAKALRFRRSELDRWAESNGNPGVQAEESHGL